MNNLSTAARDPLFFSHHAFVDQIWERLCLKQMDADISTAIDYPWDPNDPMFPESHKPILTARFTTVGSPFDSFCNIDCFSDVFFFEIAKYEQKPSCSSGCADSLQHYHRPIRFKNYCGGYSSRYQRCYNYISHSCWE
ncbi:hypothetical protein DPMN_008916 [Dreissena polymorpha]|uniref:Tyrosinase copper-binding domain-containing protein n=1 Tax=Dreissena polymorpha TaxID=45954 RepID=A0A9D4MX37_DREPO|nr:hypothetical protein DPMN_008916 [Dreissena polymorpha]